ncbi:MAG TPA: ribulose-phosphate 3-epimerase [Atribacterota bacterium]|nr:ribulose-phosphate 3-epimerase [Atribacterota bacterium]HOR42246.1 ribulose-phosphate 3-epimerase [Atribacterota bacterium]HPK86690.1 ribulose-phosphate 3-epimerase [Atribacterota bacterium]
MFKNKLAPSILNADFACLREVLDLLERCKVDLIHLDIMDGIFVPNITFGPKMVSTIRKNTNLPLSVHLMIEKPERFVEEFSRTLYEQDHLIVHAETCLHLDKTLQMIIDLGLRTGVALNPATPLEMIKFVLDKLDLILIMTVNPGFGGQQFIPAMLNKISQTREMVNRHKKDIDIEVDGGINNKNIQMVNRAGANILVVGSEIFEANDPEDMIKTIQKKLQIL